MYREAIITHISGITLDIDVYTYLTSKSLRNVRVVGNNVMACCPFHSDNKPSFGVKIDTGAYNCLGCGAKGSFASLVKRLESLDTVFDAEQYLIALYGRYDASTDEPIVLAFNDPLDVKYEITPETLNGIVREPDVLSNRGVKNRWTSEFGVGYTSDTDGNKRSYSMPYRDEHGRLVTVKHRSITGKAFWYNPPLPPRIKARILYGLDVVLRYDVKKVAITEAEIDALSVWDACYEPLAIGCIALGGKTLTDEQADVLTRHLTPETELIVATDNDGAGRLAAQQIADKMLGRFNVTSVGWNVCGTYIDADGVERTPKDANDVLRYLGDHSVVKAFQSRRPLSLELSL